MSVFPPLFPSFLSDEVTKQGLAMYINDGTARDFWTRRPWRQLGWRWKKTSSWLKKATTPSHPATTSSLMVDLYSLWTSRSKGQFLGSLPELMCYFLSSFQFCGEHAGWDVELLNFAKESQTKQPTSTTVNETWPCSKQVKANLGKRRSQTVKWKEKLLLSPNIEEVERVVQWLNGWCFKSHSIPVCHCVLIVQDT